MHVINYESFIQHKAEWKKWADKANFGMIVDEAHRIKKRGSKWSKACRLIGKRADWRLALTGTPFGQGPQDAWGVFDYMDPSIFGPYKDFENRYLITRQISSASHTWTKITGYKRKPEFQKIFHEHSYRITLNEARGKSIKIRKRKHYCNLPPAARDLYKQLDKELEAEFSDSYIETPNTMTLTMKLQQICGGWVKDADEVWIHLHNAKFDLLKNLIATEPVKAVIVCRFKLEMDTIGAMLTTLKKTWCRISGGYKFSGEFSEDYCILQIQSGIAMDLSAARKIIFYSSDFSHFNREQIRFRIRSYDTNQVEEDYLLCRNTVDEDIYTAVVKKKDLATLICDRYRSKHERATQIESSPGQIRSGESPEGGYSSGSEES
jgi:hypothetical protein